MNETTAAAFSIPQWVALVGFLSLAIAFVVAILKARASARAEVREEIVAYLESRTGRELVEGIAAASTRSHFDAVLAELKRVSSDLERFVRSAEQDRIDFRAMRDDVLILKQRSTAQ